MLSRSVFCRAFLLLLVFLIQGSLPTEASAKRRLIESPLIGYNPSSYIFVVGSNFDSVVPANSGGAINSCTSSPALPAGIQLSRGCVLSGAPSIIAGALTYTITASNSVGASSAQISIRVVPTPTPTPMPTPTPTLTPTFSCMSRSYYVDSEYGSDSNSGSSALNPWKSIAKVNSVRLNPDECVLFKRGSRWRETLMPNGSGTQGHPIVYAAYGPESDGRPVILGSVDKTGTSNWIMENPNIWYTQGVKWSLDSFGKYPGGLFHDGFGSITVAAKGNLVSNWQWWNDPANSRAYVYLDHNPGSHAIEIEQRNGVGWSASAHVLIRDFEIAYADFGVAIWQGAGWLIENVFFHDIVEDAIHANGSNPPSSAGSVRNSVFQDWNWKGHNRLVFDYNNWGANEPYMGYAVHIFQSDNWVISGNSFSMLNVRTAMDSSPIALDSGGHAKLIENNTIDGNGRILKGATTGIMIWATKAANGTDPITVRNNTIKNLPGLGIIVQDFGNYSFQGNVTIESNTLIDVANADALDSEMIRIWTNYGSSGSIVVKNNVIVGSPTALKTRPAIKVRNSPKVQILNNLMMNSDIGLSINSSSDVTARGNVATQNRSYAVFNSAVLHEEQNCWNGTIFGFAPNSTTVLENPGMIINFTAKSISMPAASPCAGKGPIPAGTTFSWN
ncbi:MAG: hypothetical protein A2428_17225 [Bdellovibrionales bacterium RIFOXYC1_FULL_54_43]|nr:MAG: hypothetical protein A2428_17225 [Bdellovibrionales bacterium RIFOXYC1_FULL_54_43]OFZ83350.1 MAG: hypothetical protein A2603_06780 [Bdellovibrionales bacterium RIFOXYD1_FULL_55_31]